MRRSAFACLLLAWSLCILSVQASAEAGYRLVPISDGGPPVGLNVFDLNNKGEAVGTNLHAFRWRRGLFLDLHDIIDPGAAQSDARAVNERGDIVGVSFDAEFSPSSYLLRHGQVIDIAAPGGADTFVSGINNRGDVIGFAGIGDDSRSFVWQRGEFTFLSSITQAPEPTNPIDINNRGVIVGVRGTGAGIHALLWERGTAMELAGLGVSEVDLSQPLDLNDRGQVLVFVRFTNRQTTVLWDRGEYSELPLLGSDQFAYSAWSINNAGDIVGATFSNNGGSIATLWRRGAPVDLNSLVRADDPFEPFVTLVAGNLINERGDIVVEGFDSRMPGVLLQYLMTRSQ
jgi:uncharacterized membrane protein